MAMAFEVVLWDFGGVLTSSPFEAFNRYEEVHGLPQDFIRGVNARNHEDNAWARFESSLIDVDTFDSAFLAETSAAGHPVSGRDVMPLLGGEVRPRMVALLDRVRATYRVACLTNNAKVGHGPGMSGTAERAAAVQAVMARFDLVIESSKEGVRKPDPRIYRLACERLAVAPEAVVYLDDLGVNLKPARALGMTTIKVTSEDQAIAELSAVLGLMP
jgi:putative hydrolase of the HAD superfamily